MHHYWVAILSLRVPGFLELLEILADPDDEGHSEKLEWVGEHFDPEEFSPDEVVFDNPDNRCLESMLFLSGGLVP